MQNPLLKNYEQLKEGNSRALIKRGALLSAGPWKAVQTASPWGWPCAPLLFSFIKWIACCSLCTTLFVAFVPWVSLYEMLFFISLTWAHLSFCMHLLESCESCHCKSLSFEGTLLFILVSPAISWGSATVSSWVCWIKYFNLNTFFKT